MGIKKFLTLLIALTGLSFAQNGLNFSADRNCQVTFQGGTVRCATYYYIVEPIKLMPFVIKHYKELKLTPEQREKIKELIKEIKDRAVDLDMKIDKLSRQVRREMLYSDNEYYVWSQLNALAALKAERSFVNYRCIRELKKILTKEQFQKLLQLAKPFKQ